MKVSEVKRSVMLCHKAGITPYIHGHRGIGKSASMGQLCYENKLGFIDFRLSQIEASDLRGLPDKQAGRTYFLPPAEMPTGDLEWEECEKLIEKAKESGREWEEWPKLQPRLTRGMLFLDEVNRANDDCLQAIFQLVLDRRIGMYSLPPGWFVVCAGNFMEGYQTNGFTDPAFINRFCHLTLSCDDSTLPEWVDYMTFKYDEVASKVIEFASQELKHLRGDIKGELGFVIQPSPRSWEMVTRVMQVIKGYKDAEGNNVPGIDYGDDITHHVISGLIGKELAISFKNYNCPVKPMDVINNGVAAMKNTLRSLDRSAVTGLTWGLAGFLKRNIEEDKFGDIAIEYAKWLCESDKKHKDIAVAFCSMLLSNGISAPRMRSSMLSNPNVSTLIGRFTKGSKTFSARLAKDPELQKILSKVSWGLPT